MKQTDYKGLMELLPLSHRSLADKADVCHKTVQRILDRDPKSYHGNAIEKRVHRVIEEEAQRIYRGIARLSGGAFEL